MQADRPPDWISQARCLGTDPDLFHPDRGDTETVVRAKLVCQGCRVREDCLDFAIANNEKRGIWGGLDEQERRRIRRQRTMARRQQSK